MIIATQRVGSAMSQERIFGLIRISYIRLGRSFFVCVQAWRLEASNAVDELLGTIYVILTLTNWQNDINLLP